MTSTDLSEGSTPARRRPLLPVLGLGLAALAALAGLAVLKAPAALVVLPFVLPIAVWVAWSDMKTMRIPNRAVMALLAVFAVAGLVALPLEDWAWRWVHFAAVLVLGFALSSLRMMGAGDAKFAAAMAPFVALADLGNFLFLFAGVTIAAFAAHRLVRRMPAVRRAAPDWESWTRSDFPMGLALASALVVYLVVSGALGLISSST